VKLLIDMNLSPTWAAYLAQRGFEAQHWSTIGDPKVTIDPDRWRGRLLPLIPGTR